MNNLSQAEKTDILLVLALAFDKKLDESGEEKSVARLVEKTFAAAMPEELESLKSRANFLDELPKENLQLWQGIRLDKLRRRGRAIRLDENINPAHIVNVLSREPQTIQNLILRNLPADLSRRIAVYLDLNFDADEISNQPSGKQINSEIIAHIRKTFLANFVALEDIFEPNDLDRFPVGDLANFVRQISLRETAIACRGISSKETLAVFLNRFAEENAKEIAHYLTELEKVRPFWVAQADELVRQTWRTDLEPDKLLQKLGLKLLAMAFAGRDETTQRFTAQKLSTRDSRRWKKFVREYEKQFREAGEEEKTALEKRRKMVEKLAVKFIQTGKL